MNKTEYQDKVGVDDRNNGRLLSECDEIPVPLRSAFLEIIGPKCRLTPIQSQAIESGICNIASHFIVSAPTNSGKTLVAWFRIFSDLLSKRGRCIYVAPLKALAEEKKDELKSLCKLIAKAGGPKIRVAITTGDYQNSGDFLGSPPPENGELIICTPERLEILLRSSENVYWARTVSTFVLDEFHLLGDSHRGATMEILVTRILALCPWSRIVALSASMSGLKNVGQWLGVTGTSVSIIESDWRYPSLNRRVVSTDDKDAFIKEMSLEVLENPNRSLLIFTSRKSDAERVAKDLKKEFKAHKSTITHLHAGLALKARTDVLKELREGKARIVAATTALKMGIDAPVTDVVVSDIYLWGNKGRNMLSYGDFLQMTGRAGRRDSPGNAVVLAEKDQAEIVSELFRTANLDILRPQLIRNQNLRNEPEEPEPVLSVLLSEIAMTGRTSITHLQKYLNRTFSGSLIGPFDCRGQVNELVRLKLAYRKEDDPDFFHPTKLGETVSSTGLSPESGAIIAGFLRALIKLDQKYEERKGRRFGYLKRLTDLDLIFICCACHECRDSWLRNPTKKDVLLVQEFIESLPSEEKPIINLWNDENSSEYPTHRLLTSLRLPFDGNKAGNSQKVFYRLMRTSMLLYHHAKGVPLASLAKKFKASLGNLENNLKFSILWVLGCFSQICNEKRCYKFNFLMMRALNLIECIAVGSELGGLLAIKGVGKNSVKKLVESGIQTYDDLVDCSLGRLINYGIEKRRAKLILKEINRKSR